MMGNVKIEIEIHEGLEPIVQLISALHQLTNHQSFEILGELGRARAVNFLAEGCNMSLSVSEEG